MPNRRHAGFTLIELVVVVAIVAILAAIALPSFADQMRKSRRSEAISKLQDIQLRLERYRVDHANYVAGIADSQYDFTWYDFTITASADKPNDYSIEAKALSTQTKDYCGDLKISVTNGGTPVKTPAKDRCW